MASLKEQDELLIYEIHTKERIYTLEAHSFEQSEYGITFWDTANNKIKGFVPYTVLNFIEVVSPEIARYHMLFGKVRLNA